MLVYLLVYLSQGGVERQTSWAFWLYAKHQFEALKRVK